MSPRLVLAAAISCLALCLPGASRAADRKPGPAGQPDVKAMIERNKQCMRKLSAEVARITFDRKDLERYLAEWQSFDALDLDDEEDGAECLDLATAVKEPKYVAWARERGVDPKGWLQKSLRISLTDAKRRAPAQAAEMKQQMEAQRREAMKQCKTMGPDACKQMEAAFASGDEMMRETTAMLALFPDANASEAALLREYEAKLKAVQDGPRRGPGEPDEDAGDVGEPEGGTEPQP